MTPAALVERGNALLTDARETAFSTAPLQHISKEMHRIQTDMLAIFPALLDALTPQGE